jgi:MscS family membrane protein
MSLHPRVNRVALFLVLTCYEGAVFAQGGPPPPSSAASASRDPPAPEEAIEPGSPRAAVAEYLEACRRGAFTQAASYLELGPEQAPRGPELARRLKHVLDRNAWIELETVSNDPGGNASDGLPPDSERIASVPGLPGREDAVRLKRVLRGEPVWLFSAATVARIDGWYEKLGRRFVLDRVPLELQRSGPLELQYWQWLAAPVVVLLVCLLAVALTRVTRSALERLTNRTEARWDNELLAHTRGPMRLAWATIIGFGSMPWLELAPPAEKALHGLLRTLLLLSIFWALVRSLSTASDIVCRSEWASSHGISRTLVPLGARVAKLLVGALAAVVMLAEFGYPVASLIAGLGIGGIAFALAAQKTVENLFGAFSIGVDQPFREGDFVKVEEFVGTVETIGLRSTRIRTLDRTLISVPNGKLAEMRLETFAARDRIRLSLLLGVVYGTTEAQMRRILEGIERVLREHPKIWPDTVVVRFSGFGPSSLDIEVMAWFQTQDFDVFRDCRQDVLLGFMAVVEGAGSSFAFPTRTVHVANLPEPLTRSAKSGPDSPESPARE